MPEFARPPQCVTSAVFLLRKHRIAAEQIAGVVGGGIFNGPADRIPGAALEMVGGEGQEQRKGLTGIVE